MVAKVQAGYAIPQLSDNSCCLVTKDDWKLAAPSAVGGVNVTAADCGGFHCHTNLADRWRIQYKVFDDEWSSELPAHRSSHGYW